MLPLASELNLGLGPLVNGPAPANDLGWHTRNMACTTEVGLIYRKGPAPKEKPREERG
jgi:hypothetical protein